MDLLLTLTDEQQQVVRIQNVKDAKGILDTVTPAVWACADQGICAIGADPADPAARSCLFTAVKPGETDATATIGSLVKSIHIKVTASADVSADLVVDPPTDQTPPAPASTP